MNTPYVRGWEGDLVRLVPISVERHYDNCFRWFNDPEITRWLSIGQYPPVTEMLEREWFEARAKDNGRDVVFAIETLEGEHIGQTGIHGVDLVARIANTGSLIGSREHQGKGYGRDAARIRSRYCFEVIGLRTLLSSTMASNIRSYKMLTGAGYEECGRIPERFYKNGRFEDEILLCLRRERWEAMQRES
ncbi:MAG: N-acetyltransferase [Chthonomonas sp.]|nr:GNAT family N-acetyltransferase [Fimbriimonadaceae bacterium]